MASLKQFMRFWQVHWKLLVAFSLNRTKPLDDIIIVQSCDLVGWFELSAINIIDDETKQSTWHQIFDGSTRLERTFGEGSGNNYVILHLVAKYDLMNKVEVSYNN